MSAPLNFRIDTIQTRSGITIKLRGELDSATCDELVSRFEAVAVDSPLKEFALDLADVSFIDSSGMRAIILVERLADERGFGLTIVPPSETLTNLLAVTGVADRTTLAPQAAASAPPAPFIERIELALPREPAAPARARAELREALGGRIRDADRATITLLTSELVTNAVIHPGPGIGGSVGLRITAYPDRIRVEVSDAGAGFDADDLAPRPRSEAGGHGLVVVESLSSRWGTGPVVVEERDGFCVWFELDVAYDLPATADAPEPDEPQVAAAES